jgi:RimJ/RimL family protein N-acetyltransferase
VHGLPIETPQLRLRHFVVEDAERSMVLNAEPTTRRWLPSHVYASLSDAVEAMQYLVGCYSSPADPRLGPYVLALELARTKQLLGHVGFSPLYGEVEISYAVAEADRGHGHASAAVSCACKWLAGQFGVRKVLALTASANTPSRRLLVRTGFVHVRDETRRFQGVEQPVSHYRLDTVPRGG